MKPEDMYLFEVGRDHSESRSMDEAHLPFGLSVGNAGKCFTLPGMVGSLGRAWGSGLDLGALNRIGF